MILSSKRTDTDYSTYSVVVLKSYLSVLAMMTINDDANSFRLMMIMMVMMIVMKKMKKRIVKIGDAAVVYTDDDGDDGDDDDDDVEDKLGDRVEGLITDQLS